MQQLMHTSVQQNISLSKKQKTNKGLKCLELKTDIELKISKKRKEKEREVDKNKYGIFFILISLWHIFFSHIFYLFFRILNIFNTHTGREKKSVFCIQELGSFSLCLFQQ